DLDLLASSRIHAVAARALLDAEGAEPDVLELVALRQGMGDDTEHFIHGLADVYLFHAGSFCYHVDEFFLVHWNASSRLDLGLVPAVHPHNRRIESTRTRANPCVHAGYGLQTLLEMIRTGTENSFWCATFFEVFSAA